MLHFVFPSSFSFVRTRDSTLRAASLSCRSLFAAFHPVLLQNVTLTKSNLFEFHTLLIGSSAAEQVQSVYFKATSYKENVPTNVSQTVSTSNLQSQPSSEAEFIRGQIRTVLNKIYGKLTGVQTLILQTSDFIFAFRQKPHSFLVNSLKKLYIGKGQRTLFGF